MVSDVQDPAGVEPQIQNLQGMPADLFPWWMERLRRLENVDIPRLADLPPEAAAERAMLEAQGVQSLVSVPILEEASFIGFVGFDWVREPRVYGDDEVKLLRMVGGSRTRASEWTRRRSRGSSSRSSRRRRLERERGSGSRPCTES